METTQERPRQTSRIQRRTVARLRVPAFDDTDLSLHQRRSLNGARRRLRNVEQKLNEARVMLADAPPEVDNSIRTDLWQIIQLIHRMEEKLLLKRGRKPLSRPQAHFPAPVEHREMTAGDNTITAV